MTPKPTPRPQTPDFINDLFDGIFGTPTPDGWTRCPRCGGVYLLGFGGRCPRCAAARPTRGDTRG